MVYGLLKMLIDVMMLINIYSVGNFRIIPNFTIKFDQNAFDFHFHKMLKQLRVTAYLHDNNLYSTIQKQLKHYSVQIESKKLR